MVTTKSIVTGAGGFIGKALVSRQVAEGIDVIALISSAGDIQDVNTLSPYSGEDITRVFHLAARTYVPDSWDDPQSFYATNLLGTTNVLEYCRQNEVRLTFVSAYVYGQPATLPIDEDATVQPNNPYALSKYLAEQACRYYADNFGLSVTIIRPFNIYGIGQDMKFLIPSIVKQTLCDSTIVVQDLEPRRDYLYLDDLVDAVIATSQIDSGFEIYNVGYGESLSVKDVIDQAQGVAGTTKEIISNNRVRQQEIPDVVANISKIKKHLGWSPATTFDEGLKKLFQSLQEQL